MLSVIAHVLRKDLESLAWIERLAGLTMPASRPIYTTGADMQQVQTGVQTYPVACGVNSASCWENGAYKILVPDKTKSAIAFFVDGGGAQNTDTEGYKGNAMRYTFNLRLLVWLNLERLGEPITGNSCSISARIVPYFVQKLMGKHTATGKFSGALEESLFKSIEVLRVDELEKSQALFSPFDFSRDPMLFFSPYYYFGLSVRGEFIFDRGCLPTFGQDWEPAEGCYTFEPDPGGVANPGAGLCKRLFQCLGTNLTETFNDDAAGIAGGYEVDDWVFYRCGASHVDSAEGVIKMLPKP